MRKILFTLGCGLVVTIAGTLIYINKPPRNVAGETGIPVTAQDLYTKFTTNEPQANQTYLNKVVQVSGQVLEVKPAPNAGKVVVLSTGDPMFGVACTINQSETTTSQQVKPGEKITIKGICTGYLSDVVLTNSYLIN